MDRKHFDWDEHNVRHSAARKASLEEFEQCLANGPRYVETQIDEASGEERIIEVGHTNDVRILLIGWTRRECRIRPVTAFAADRTTRDLYITERFWRNDAEK